MEKKTIGGFISALRKANGMTQKDLADKLNVSDKAVSRWERDECAPDLSLIPVIADIFGVTADELLRGQRKSAAEASVSSGESCDFSAKSKKQIKYLLNQSLIQYKIQSIIASVIAVLGFIIAAIINSFNRAHLGLGIGCIFYLTAAVCLIIFTILALSRTDSEEFEAEDISSYKKSAAYTAWTAASVIFIIFNITMPLITTEDVYFGLQLVAWFGMGLVSAAIGIIIVMTARFILTNVLTKRGIITLTERIRHNRRLTLKMCVICAAVIAVTFFGQLMFNLIADSEMIFVEGTTFDNFDDFKEYMETPTQYNSNDYYSVNIDAEWVSESDYESYSYEEIITDSNGKELCRYIQRNENIRQISYSGTDDYLPVTVYTFNDSIKQRECMKMINFAFIFIYLAEVGVCSVIHLKKRVK